MSCLVCISNGEKRKENTLPSNIYLLSLLRKPVQNISLINSNFFKTKVRYSEFEFKNKTVWHKFSFRHAPFSATVQLVSLTLNLSGGNRDFFGGKRREDRDGGSLCISGGS